MKPRPLPDAAHLRKCFRYDPQTGELFWRERPPHHFRDPERYRVSRTRCAGKVAGTPAKNVGLVVRLDGRLLKVSRVIWKLVTGSDPASLLDHRNGDPLDNRWDNLREATHAQNMQNVCRRRRNHDLPKGVHRSRDKYRTQITLKRRTLYLGVFDTVEEARLAYLDAGRCYFGEFFNPG